MAKKIKRKKRFINKIPDKDRLTRITWTICGMDKSVKDKIVGKAKSLGLNVADYIKIRMLKQIDEDERSERNDW